MSSRRTTLAAYARAIERALSRARGGPVVVSERDFALVRGWHDRGVPLAVVLEALRSAEVRGKVPRSLAYLAPAVDESCQSLALAAAPARPSESHPGTANVLHAWTARRDTLDNGSPLRGVLDHAIARLAGGDEPAAVDAALDADLVAAAPADLRATCEASAQRVLSRYRERMPSGVFERTLRRAVADRLRERLGIPRLRSGS